MQVAQSLQSFLQLTDPVQQVQLIKKVGPLTGRGNTLFVVVVYLFCSC